MTAKARTWFARVEEWRKSGLTSREFCKGKAFTNRSLLWWSSELNRRVREGSVKKPAPPKPGARFARVVTSPASRTADMVVRVGGVQVVVQRGFDQTLLVEVVRALEVAK